MNKIKIIQLSLMTIYLSFNYTSAQQAGIEPTKIQRNGLSGFTFLKINPDIKSAAMGNTRGALGPANASGVFANPSSISSIEKLDFYFGTINYVADITYNAFSVVNKSSFGNIGFSIASLDMGDIPETMNSLVSDGSRTESTITGRNFTGGNIAAGITYARNFTDRLSIGVNARYISETIDDVSMNNISFDVGTTYYTGFKSLRLGMVFSNLGDDTNLANWDEDFQVEPIDVKMPWDFRVGVAMDFLQEENLTLAIEASHPNDNSEKLHIGAQYDLGGIIFLRGGYKINYDEDGLTFGAGINYNNFNINFALVSMNRLGNVSMISLGFNL